MSLFANDFVAAEELLLEGYGDAITYTPLHGTPVSLTAIVTPEETEVVTEQERQIKRRVRHLTFTTDPTSTYGGVASPAVKAEITIDSEAYSICGILSKSASTVTVKVARPEQMDRSRFRT